MTKKEAIEWLKSLNYCDGEETQEVAQAIDMAINALEQPTSDDCVSREQAIAGLGEEPYMWTDSECEIQEHYDWKQHKEMLENLPSVTPTPTTGHWIYEPNCWLRCSECGQHYPHTSIYEVKGSNYCPNCGAKMSGGE